MVEGQYREDSVLVYILEMRSTFNDVCQCMHVGLSAQPYACSC